ncbi:MAG: hypothetical protein HUU02_00255 [Bacteroidetes bacterium]|nr:hypothetical protein [Bacteroidota bacterium]
MRTYLATALALIILTGCGSSINTPSVKDSQALINAVKPQLDRLDSIVNAQTRKLPRGHDLITSTRTSGVNRLLTAVAERTAKDIHVDFLATRPLWKEEKSVLGIGYTNAVNVDTGTLDIDLKKFLFTEIVNNTIYAQIEIEGTGALKASGSYAGVSARIAPQVHFYLDEQVFFTVAAADSDFIRLNPVPKTVKLKTKITIDLLGWQVPYYKEIPLLTTDLIKPVLIPSAVTSEIVFPVPAAQYGADRMAFVKRYLRFSRSTVNTTANAVEYRSNIDFIKP